MKQTLYNLYTQAKKLPVVGPLVQSLRDLYHHPFLEKGRLLKRDLAHAHELMTHLYGKQSDAHRYVDAFFSSDQFHSKFSHGHSGDFDVLVLYGITRMQLPEVVIETGVASGRSSAAILRALEDNGKGKLYSIDLPQYYEGKHPDSYITHEGNSELKGFVPNGKQPGWLVPDELRHRWELILGDSNKEIPKLLEQVSALDIFYHDGDHSYESMSFEFRSMWERIRSGGILLSDDTRWNNAWGEFVAQNSEHKNFIYRGFGVIKK